MSTMVSIETMESELKIINGELNGFYKRIGDLEKKIAEKESQIRALAYELRQLDKRDPVPYVPEGGMGEFKKGLEFNKLVVSGIVLTCTLGGVGLHLLKPDQFNLFLMGVLGGLTGCAINYLRSYFSPVLFQYEGVPFKQVHMAYDHGYVQELENKSSEGRYQAHFFANPFHYSEAELVVLVEKRDILENASRIRAIRNEMRILEYGKQDLEAKRMKETAEKDALMSQSVRLEKQVRRIRILEKRKGTSPEEVPGLVAQSQANILGTPSSSTRERGNDDDSRSSDSTLNFSTNPA